VHFYDLGQELTGPQGTTWPLFPPFVGVSTQVPQGCTRGGVPVVQKFLKGVQGVHQSGFSADIFWGLPQAGTPGTRFCAIEQSTAGGENWGSDAYHIFLKGAGAQGERLFGGGPGSFFFFFLLYSTATPAEVLSSSPLTSPGFSRRCFLTSFYW